MKKIIFNNYPVLKGPAIQILSRSFCYIKMAIWRIFSVFFFLTLFSCNGSEGTWDLTEIRIRDPFILPVKDESKYYMYAQMENRIDRNDDLTGVEVYVSSDLNKWTGPEPVYVVPDTLWARFKVWAPEVHFYHGKYYLFVTFTAQDTLDMERPVKMEEWPLLHKRGTQILVADSPAGPFVPFNNKPHTPEDWSALDGTLYIENGIPYMVFCHEWSQIIDGTIEYIELTMDLSATTGEPVTLFKATDAEWVRPYLKGYVTDGPFFYKTDKGTLIMGWSSFGENGYAIGTAISESGSIKGPWKQSELLYAENGGHGMLFRTFDNELMLTFHQPNSGRLERAQIYRITELDNNIIISGKYLP
jgi:GH43 family beta-xylosidase